MPPEAASSIDGEEVDTAALASACSCGVLEEREHLRTASKSVLKSLAASSQRDLGVGTRVSRLAACLRGCYCSNIVVICT